MTNRVKLTSITGVLALAAALVFGFMMVAPTALAAKPDQTETKWNNGFPSDPHFNLNIHGNT